jgi:hypothetical protein
VLKRPLGARRAKFDEVEAYIQYVEASRPRQRSI